VAKEGWGDLLDYAARRWVCPKTLVHADDMVMPCQGPMEAVAARLGGRCGAGAGEAVRPQKVCMDRRVRLANGDT
jgi:hypothetical protein